jgi:hypothetical protein
MADSTILTPGC